MTKKNFKFNYFGEDMNRVKEANVFMVFKSFAIILDNDIILQGDENDLSVYCFEVGKTYTISLLDQSVQNNFIAH